MKTENKEKRTYTIPVTLRAKEDGEESRTIEGYAALYNERSEKLWDFYEEIAPGAFDSADLTDVRALFNHDPNGILARTTSGTLELEVTDKGLFYRFESPKTTAGNDLLESVRRGDISQSSFAFTLLPDGDEWRREKEDDMLVRTITRIDKVFDVSPVTYPAYSPTTVTARSFEQATAENKENNDFNFRARQLLIRRSINK